MFGARARQAGVIVEPGGLAGAHAAEDARSLKRPPPPGRERLLSVRGETGAVGGRAVGLVSGNADERHAQNLGDLLGDESEQSVRWCSAGDERGDGSKRSLL